MLHTRPLANAKMQNLQMETPEEGRGLTAHSVREIQSPFRALNSTNPTTSWGSSFDPTGLPSGCESQSRQATNPNFTVPITRNYFQQQIQKNTTSHYLLKGTSTSKAGLDVRKSCWLGKGCQAGITPPPRGVGCQTGPGPFPQCCKNAQIHPTWVGAIIILRRKCQT